jgi:acylphosphatase
MKEAIRAIVSGKVQGVWFRKYTKTKADQLGIKGYVKNQPDGTVLVRAEGPLEEMKIFKQWLHIGSPASQVEQVTIEQIKPEGFTSFEIIP